MNIVANSCWSINHHINPETDKYTIVNRLTVICKTGSTNTHNTCKFYEIPRSKSLVVNYHSFNHFGLNQVISIFNCGGHSLNAYYEQLY